MRTKNSVGILSKYAFLFHIGQCPTCMRQSFNFAAVAWVAFGVEYGVRHALLESTEARLYIETALIVSAISATGLWMLHVMVAAWRNIPCAEAEALPVTSGLSNRSRRVLVKNFARMIVSIAAATAMPSLARAWAECPGRLTCPMTSCGNGNAYCCPSGYPILSLCDCRCYTSVQDTQCNQTSSCFDQNF